MSARVHLYLSLSVGAFVCFGFSRLCRKRKPQGFGTLQLSGIENIPNNSKLTDIGELNTRLHYDTRLHSTPRRVCLCHCASFSEADPGVINNTTNMGCNTSQEKPGGACAAQVDDNEVVPSNGEAPTTDAADVSAGSDDPTKTASTSGVVDATSAGKATESGAAASASPVNGKATDVAPLAAPDATHASGDEEEEVEEGGHEATLKASNTTPPPLPQETSQCNGTTATTTHRNDDGGTTGDEDDSVAAIVLNGEVMGKAEGRWICV